MEKFIRMFVNFKGVIRLIAFIAVIMFFVPSYAVSCGSYGSFDFSQANLAFGRMVEGERTKFFLPFALAFLIPIAIIVISFLWKKENEKLMSMLSAIGGAAGFLMVIIMRIALSVYLAVNTDDFYGIEVKAHFRFGAFFILLLYIGIAVISLLSMQKIIDADKCFLKEETIQKFAKSMAMQPQPGQPIPPAQPQVQPQAVQGQPQAASQVGQEAAAQPQAASQPSQEAAAQETAAAEDLGARFCAQCGSKLALGAKFCGKCGSSVNQ